MCYKKKQQQGLEIKRENYFRLGGREGLRGIFSWDQRMRGSTVTLTESRTKSINAKLLGKEKAVCDLETEKAKMLGCWALKIWVQTMTSLPHTSLTHTSHLTTSHLTPQPGDFYVTRYSG